MKARPIIAALLLTGCWVTTDQVASKVADVPTVGSESELPSETTSESDPLVLSSIEPEVGSNAGGLEVVIDVGPLDPDDVSVAFAGVPATVLSASTDQVTVRTPASGATGRVAVVVESRGERVLVNRAFYFWEDGAGRAGLVGVVNNHDFERDYYGEPHHERSASLVWIEPMALRWWELYAPSIDTCARDYSRGSPHPVFLEPEASRIQFLGPSGEHLLSPDGRGEFFELERQGGSFTKGETYDIAQPPGRAGFPEIYLPDVVEMPAPGFRVTAPAMQDSPPSLVPFGSISLSWTGGEPGDYVLITVRRLEPGGDAPAVADSVSCAVRDNGHFLVSNEHWSGWDPGSGIIISVGRAIEGQGQLPTNNAEARVYGIQWWHGVMMQGG